MVRICGGIFLVFSVFLIMSVVSCKEVKSDEILCNDDFNDCEADGWKEINGVWSVTKEDENCLYSQSNIDANQGISVLEKETGLNYIIESRVKNRNNIDSGLVFGFKDIKNWYAFRPVNYAGNQHLGKMVDGNFNWIGSGIDTYLEMGQWYGLKVIIKGTIIKCYVGNILVGEAEEPSLISGKVGLITFGSSAIFDDFKVIKTD